MFKFCIIYFLFHFLLFLTLHSFKKQCCWRTTTKRTSCTTFSHFFWLNVPRICRNIFRFCIFFHKRVKKDSKYILCFHAIPFVLMHGHTKTTCYHAKCHIIPCIWERLMKTDASTWTFALLFPTKYKTWFLICVRHPNSRKRKKFDSAIRSQPNCWRWAFRFVYLHLTPYLSFTIVEFAAFCARGK